MAVAALLTVSCALPTAPITVSFNLSQTLSDASAAWLAFCWASAAALFVYAGAFSFAYVSLPAATGALILFGAVQLTMLGYGLLKGDRLSTWQVAGLLIAAGGLVTLLLPGLASPSVSSAA